jgi:hypothetical protein
MRPTRSRQKSSGHSAVAVLTLGPAAKAGPGLALFPGADGADRRPAGRPLRQAALASGCSRTAADEPAGHRGPGRRGCRAADRGDHRRPSYHLRAYGTPPGPPDRRAGICRSDGGRRARLAHGADRRGHRRARCLTRQPAARGGTSRPAAAHLTDWPARAPARNTPYDLICTPQLRIAEAPAVVPNSGSGARSSNQLLPRSVGSSVSPRGNGSQIPRAAWWWRRECSTCTGRSDLAGQCLDRCCVASWRRARRVPQHAFSGWLCSESEAVRR